MSEPHLSRTPSRKLLTLCESVFLATLAGCVMVLAISLKADPEAFLRVEPGVIRLAAR